MPERTLSHPELSWQDGLPIASQFNDPYFSRDNGLAESQHVFLQHNGIPDRWQQWPWAQQPSFCILETGFGTGLNFLLSWQAWQHYQASLAQPDGWLHFTSIEKYPLSPEQLTQALALWPELSALAKQLLAQYPLPLPGAHTLYWPDERISLTLYFADIATALPELSGPVHAWYLDGFAPARNPDMWCDSLYLHMSRLSQIDEPPMATTVATFTAAGEVRRQLQGAGFSVQKQTGFGRKRDMLAGVYTQSQGPKASIYSHSKPWLVLPRVPHSQKTIAVIGAGLAGCFSARSLAERGFKVQVFDPEGIAQQASGNAQGGIYLKLSAGDSAIHTDFYLSAYQFALKSFERYLGAGNADNPNWQQCGLLQLAFSDKEAQRQEKFSQTHRLPKELIQTLSQEQASDIAGNQLSSGGLFFPQAGWVNPVALCEALLQHPNIAFEQCAIRSLKPLAQGWQLNADKQVFNVEQVLLANAMASQTLLPEAYLSLKSIRGQLSYLHAAKAPKLNTVLSGRTYLAPPLNGRQCLGATFTLNDAVPSLREQDHRENLGYLPEFGPAWQQQAAQGLELIQGGRVGFRCATPDYLPMVGAIPHTAAFLQDFKALTHDKNQVPARPCQHLAGLWLNVGHGSRGLVSVPLSAEILAQQINQSANVVSQSMLEALWPGRFLLRDMVRGQLN